MKAGDWKLQDLSGDVISVSELENAGILENDPIPTFYQTGYLTIRDYNAELESVTLDYPSEDVKSGFLNFLIPYCLDDVKSSTEFTIDQY